MNNKSGLQGAAPAGAFRRPTAVRRLLGRRWVLSPRRGETLLVMPNAANHLQGPMLATASITGFAGISHFTLRRRAHNVRPYKLFSVKPEIPVVLRQHRTIPALRLKHRSGSCGTASALPKCRVAVPASCFGGKSPSHSATAAPASVRCFRHWRRSPLQHPALSALLA